jgi:glycosyltransferase involved in cell wall biosynthesis
MEINNLPAVPRKKVMELFTHKAINVVPSRYESLSLSALESLLQGCPTIISSRCGAVEYLKEYRPEIPFHEIDISCSRDGTQKLQYIIENYAEERAKLIAAIQSLPVIDKTAALQKIYGNDKSAKISVRQTTNQLFSQFLYLNDSNKKNLAFAIKQVITKHSSIPLRAVTLKVLGKNLNIARKIKRLLTNSGTQKRQIEHNFKRIAKLVLNDPKSIAQWYFTLSSNSLKKLIHHVSPEKNLQDIREKIQLIENLTANRYVDRARYYYELAILENKRNNPLISAVYKARIMRWQHKDIYSDLDNTAYTFNQLGYRAEAEALLAIHSPTSTYDSQLALLNKKLADHKKKPDMPFEFIDDKREKKNYKISVIVSLYKAADKFATFIRMLEQQTAIQANDVEVVFIDSGSPTDEYSIFKQYDGILKNAMVYARSQNRETIQCAWNRGIKLCTGTYLTFQAADEAIHPECLEILSKELDNNPTVDWIMGSAIVAEIDKQETLHCDIMAYDRSDAKHHSHILDCTYVNYTPGLYRKSVHDLHGFYDETFSAAGDTEFKNRVSPFINIKFIPNVLGAYNNYQEERTTAHPRAEIEDIRAWYLFRTPAGIAYLFQNRSEEELLDVLRDTLGYRKSFCGHISTDIELGLSVSIYLHKKTGNEKYQLLANEYRQLIDSCNNVELFNSTRSPLKTVVKETRAFSKTKKNISKMLSMPSIQSTSIFHDNRYEQHWWPWRNTK